ncbi:MAG TPA: imidazoleglycerol-phosphate dehydratase HisB, partial [Bacteroidales bacterium]|nr:imidazoleglycerol-phosphate dehydratase HisB [Bacteroidales bacterium]
DRLTDTALAKNLGCRAIFLGKEETSDAILTTTDWNEIYAWLKNIPRKARITRKTGETDITVEVNLDGWGKYDINTGIGFFDHMLEQLARHGNIDLIVTANGDLHVDAHHTVEDVAITLGQAFEKALGKKKGIERYSFVLPMDDCLARVAIDFGGRPWLVWDVSFDNDMTGELPAEMYFHFFKSFSDNAGCNLNISAEGQNDHHKAESVFKAFARAVKIAVSQTDNFNIPTTKGTL